MGSKLNAYRILVGKPEGNRPLGRTIRRWVDNIKMDLRKDFFFYEKPILFAICKNTFSKWKVGGRMAWRRVLSSAPL
jgi:hypothetical protein